MTPIRLLLVDDQELVRAGFAMILDARDDLHVAGHASNGDEAIAKAAELKPDIVLMDIRMPVTDGITATRKILSSRDQVRVLVLTTFDEDELVHGALRAGASGFLLKDIRPADLVEAVRIVHRGDALLAPSVTRRLLSRFAALAPVLTVPPAIGHLTDRERQVLELIGRGATNSEIAGQLRLSEATVKTHVTAILRKLPARDRVQAVIAAYDCGLVGPGSSP